MIVEQIWTGNAFRNFNYLIACGETGEAMAVDPLPLLRTCEALGSKPARTLMVGDSSNDAQAAQAAGCPVVLVSYGYNHGEPVAAAGADAVVDRIDEIPRLLLAG